VKLNPNQALKRSVRRIPEKHYAEENLDLTHLRGEERSSSKRGRGGEILGF